MGKRTRKQLLKLQQKAVGRSPTHLKTVQIALPHKPAPVRGTFGAASECVSIDPKTGLPR